MRPRGTYWNRALSIIDRLYKQSASVSYHQVIHQWYLGRPPRSGIPSPPTQQTFSRIWNEYKQQNGLNKIDGTQLVSWMTDQFGHRNLDPNMERSELEVNTSNLMAISKLVKPSTYRFQRCLSTALREYRQEKSECRLMRLGKSLNVSIRDIPIAQRWTTAQELLRYPPAQVGRANIPKMAKEYLVFRELLTTLETNNLDPKTLLGHSDCERLFQFVEKRPPSILNRWEQDRILEALPFYLAGRLRESIDSVLICFVRKARLLRSRVKEEVEENRHDESLAFLERSERDIRDLQTAISEALSIGTPEPLQPFQKKLSHLHKDGLAALDQNRLYKLIGSRGSYTRKLARRLVGIQFQGHDAHARALVEVLQEVLTFTPFEKEIPMDVAEKLAFLQAPQNLLLQRQVFEPVILITLADYLWSGRVTVSLSKRFANVWEDISHEDIHIDVGQWTSHRREQLDNAWRAFEKEAEGKTLVKDGRLHIKRPPKRLSEDQEIQHRQRHEVLLRKLRTVSILEVVLKVHQSTGFLDEFTLGKNSPHKISNEERLRNAAGVLVSLGMNLGKRDFAAVLGSDYSVGRIQTFTNNYFIKSNIEAALERLIMNWDKNNMGEFWGTGHLVSVDGRVIGTYRNNLLSRYHYRKTKSGMTVYWFRRDDGIATRVRALGNQEWESWYVLDELLHPLAGQLINTSCGDTQGQFLALWGFADVLNKEIMTRFRRPARVLLYKPTGKNRAGLKGLRTVQWNVIERGLPGIFRLAKSLKDGKVLASEVLRRWHLHDEEGCDIAQALRELGKVARTEFLFRYAQDKNLQCRIRDACNNAESWNSFHEAIFWGNGGKIRSNNPHRQEEILLALSLLLNSIVFYNVDFYSSELRKARAPTPVIWDHIQVLGKYQLKKSWFQEK